MNPGEVEASSPRAATSLPEDGIWPAIWAVIDEHPDPALLRAHGLLPLAIARWKAASDTTSVAFDTERAATIAVLMEAEALIARLARDLREPFLVLKGTEVARFYPDPTLRVQRDVDVLAPNADAAHARLMQRGWREQTGPDVLAWYDDIHQTHPLVAPGITMPLELHRRPNWPTWGEPPSFAILCGEAIQSTVNADQALAPRTEHQALIVLAHSWARQPFDQFSQLIDFALLVEASDPRILRASARRWGVDRLLDVALRTVDSALLGRGKRPLTLRLFGGHVNALALATPRQRQFNRYGASFLVAPVWSATRAAVTGVGRRVRVSVRTARMTR